MNFAPGTIIDGKYAIIRSLGEGGMGAVFCATELELNREVAIKVLHVGLLTDDEQRSRFEREGKILSQLSHPNILTFFKFGIWEPQTPYIVMEYLEGTTLQQQLSEQTFTLDHCIEIMKQLCDGVSFAHGKGIVHRDIKPGNIFVIQERDHSMTVKLVDFGLARILSEGSRQHLTRTGELIGSVYYMSPEQCQGQNADSRSDIYSLGCVLFEMCCGHMPFDADNPIGLMHKHTSEPPEIKKAFAKIAVTAQPIVDALNTVLQKCLAKQPDERYQSVEAFKQDLLMIQQGKLPIHGAPVVKKPPLLRTRAAILASIVIVFATAALAARIIVDKRNQLSPTELLNNTKSRDNEGLSLQARIGLLRTVSRPQEKFAACKHLLQCVEAGPSLPPSALKELYMSLRDSYRSQGAGREYEHYLQTALKTADRRNQGNEWKATIHGWLAEYYAQEGNQFGVEGHATKALKLFRPSGVNQQHRDAVLALACRSLRLQGRCYDNINEVTKAVIRASSDRTTWCFVPLSTELCYMLLLKKPQLEHQTFKQTLEYLDQCTYEQSYLFLQGWHASLVSANRLDLVVPRTDEWLLHLRKRSAEEVATGLLQASTLLDDERERAASMKLLQEACRLAKHASENLAQCAHSKLALAQLNAGHFTAARESIDRALKYEAGNIRHLCELASACLHYGLLAEADRTLDTLDQALKQQDAKGPDILNQYELVIATRPCNRAMNKKALDYLSRCQKLVDASNTDEADNENTVARIRFLSAAILSQLGKGDEAAQLIEQALPVIRRTNSHQGDLALLMLAEKQMTSGDNTLAEKTIYTAIAMARERHDLLGIADTTNYAARLFDKFGQSDKAAACLNQNTKLLSFVPYAGGAAQTLAQYYLTRGRPRDAISCLAPYGNDKLPKTAPQNIYLMWQSIQLLRGLAYQDLGQTEMAIKCFKRGIEVCDIFPLLNKAQCMAQLIGCQLSSKHSKADRKIAALINTAFACLDDTPGSSWRSPKMHSRFSTDLTTRQLLWSQRALWLFESGDATRAKSAIDECLRLCARAQTYQTRQALKICSDVSAGLNEKSTQQKCEQLLKDNGANEGYF